MSGKALLSAALCVLMVAVLGSPQDGGERIKRQAPGPPQEWKELMKCCPIPMVIKRESRSGCFPAGRTGPPPPPVAGAPKNCGNHTCIVECAYRAQSLLTSGNLVDTTKLTARIAELVAANPAWTTQLNSALASCTGTNAPAISTTAACKSGAGEMTMCINNYLYKNCPVGVKSTTTQCNDLLAKVG